MFRVHHIGILFIIFLTTGCSKITNLIDANNRINSLDKAVPEYQHVDEVRYLDQQWDKDITQKFYHISQGTLIMPYDWFVSLEQPTSLFFEQPLLIEPEYLGRFGFIPDPSGTNPEKLPIGFAKDTEFIPPQGGNKMTVVGLTCAACHTGELHIKSEGKTIGVRIVGGPAMIDAGSFTKATGLALGLTAKLSWKFKRFARRVLKRRGEEYTEEKAEALEKIVNAAVQRGIAANDLYDKTIRERLKLDPDEFQGGFSRTDALDRILNQVFGDSLLLNEENQLAADNFIPVNAPVNFPHIWDAPWFDWVQYNASIHQPIVRNAGEALGVKAPANLTEDDPENGKLLYKSTVKIQNLYQIEEWLAGEKPFAGLASPDWPEDLFGKIDHKMAAKGKELYIRLCQGCHLPPLEELQKELHKPSSKYWRNDLWTQPREPGISLLRVGQIPLQKIGTDPTLLENFNEAKIEYPGALKNTGKFKLNGDTEKDWEPITKDMGMGTALGNVVENVTNRWYELNNTPPDERDKINGYRNNLIKADPVYKARPLNGIWATAPFLHNGSVPTLYDLLSPVEDRPKSFYLGSKEFDPVKVGFKTDTFKGGYKLDTSLKGNLNIGHQKDFLIKGENGTLKSRPFTDEERYAIIEYLKTLSNPPKYFENIPSEEAGQIAKIKDAQKLFQQKRYKDKNLAVLRNVHPKAHGCVKASFKINPDIATKYQVGIFAKPGHVYDDVKIRFSNASVLVKPDGDFRNGTAGSRGMALEIKNADGEFIIGERYGIQNFLMINQPVFAFANVADYLEITETQLAFPNNPKIAVVKFFFTLKDPDNPAGKKTLNPNRAKGFKRIQDIGMQEEKKGTLGTQYFGAAPFRFGKDRVMKFSAKPCTDLDDLDLPEILGPNHLGEGFNKAVPEKDHCFDFMVQVPEQAQELKIEDTTHEWEEAAIPFVKVAKINIPQNSLLSDDECKALELNPWYSLMDHEPLGGINRLRKPVYLESAKGRR